MLIGPQNLPVNVQKVRTAIGAAATQCGRSVDSVTLLAVSKGQSAASVRAVAAANASDRPQVFKDAKRDTARFYFARILPRTLAHKAAIESGADSLMALPEAGFGPQG